jgi:hypothetical protein
VGTRGFSLVVKGLNLKLTTHFHVVVRLKMGCSATSPTYLHGVHIDRFFFSFCVVIQEHYPTKDNMTPLVVFVSSSWQMSGWSFKMCIN